MTITIGVSSEDLRGKKMHIFLCVSECAVCVFLLTYLNLSHVYVLLELAFTFVVDVIEG